MSISGILATDSTWRLSFYSVVEFSQSLCTSVGRVDNAENMAFSFWTQRSNCQADQYHSRSSESGTSVLTLLDVMLTAGRSRPN